MWTFTSLTCLALWCATIATVHAACSYTFENADCAGHDVVHAKLNRAACQAACTQRADCLSFQQRGNDCWLKNHVCSRKELSNVGHRSFAQFTKHCGACSFTFENADCAGHDVFHAKLNRAACQAACTRREDCLSFQQRGNDCWLKNHVCSRKELSNVGHRSFAQFTKHCGACSYTFENADCAGHDVVHAKLNRAACQAACNRRADCLSFQQRGNDCWLKNHVCSRKELSNVGHRSFAQFTKHCVAVVPAKGGESAKERPEPSIVVKHKAPTTLTKENLRPGGKFDLKSVFKGLATCPKGTKSEGDYCVITDYKIFIAWLKIHATTYHIVFSSLPLYTTTTTTTATQFSAGQKFPIKFFRNVCPKGTKAVGQFCEVTSTDLFLAWLKVNAKAYGIQYDYSEGGTGGGDTGGGDTTETHTTTTTSGGGFAVGQSFSNAMFGGKCPTGTAAKGANCVVNNATSFMGWLKVNGAKYGISFSTSTK